MVSDKFSRFFMIIPCAYNAVGIVIIFKSHPLRARRMEKQTRGILGQRAMPRRDRQRSKCADIREDSNTPRRDRLATMT